MPISAPPTIPQITDPSTFATRAQAWVVWQANELYPALEDSSTILTLSTSSTSTTSNTIGTGAKTFTVETGKGYVAGQYISIAYTTNPNNRMLAIVTSYNSGTGALVVDVQSVSGSGTYTAWSIALAYAGLVQDGKNLLINAGFRINQRGYVSNAVLAAGAYGHDRFKAGASGGDYTFTQLNTNTQITIASGKSLIQVIEDLNVHETAYVLSWEGTAQARVGVNSATPSGAYAASPILITGQTVGATMSVEFNTGTLGKAQLEKGTIATPFENRSYSTELALCQRYYYRIKSGVAANMGSGYAESTTSSIFLFPLNVQLRVDPTTLEQSGTATDYSIVYGNAATANLNAVPTFAATSKYIVGLRATTAAVLTANGGCLFRLSNANAYLGWSAEL